MLHAPFAYMGSPPPLPLRCCFTLNLKSISGFRSTVTFLFNPNIFDKIYFLLGYVSDAWSAKHDDHGHDFHLLVIYRLQTQHISSNDIPTLTFFNPFDVSKSGQKDRHEREDTARPLTDGNFGEANTKS